MVYFFLTMSVLYFTPKKVTGTVKGTGGDASSSPFGPNTSLVPTPNGSNLDTFAVGDTRLFTKEFFTVIII